MPMIVSLSNPSGGGTVSVASGTFSLPADVPEPDAGTLVAGGGFAYAVAFPTSARPTRIEPGASIFNLTLGRPVWWTGTGWVDATGAAA